MDSLFFMVFAALAVICAVNLVLQKHPISSALSLVGVMAALAALYLILGGEFIAAAQLIVYAGAVVILFVFVIMLIGPDATPPADSKAIFSRTVGAVALGFAAIVTGVLAARAGGGLHRMPAYRPEFGTIDSFGRELFTRGLVPFELTTALFVVAVVGAIAIARGRHKSDEPAAKEGSP